MKDWWNNLKTTGHRWLRWSEQYTQTDMVYLAKGMSWSTLAKAVSAIAGFGLAVAMGNLLPKDEYGKYKYIMSVTGIFFVTTLPRFNTALKRAVSERYEGDILPVVKTRMKWATLGAIGNLGVAGYYYFAGNMEFAIGFLAAAVVFPFMQPTGVFGAVFEGRKEFKHSTIYRIITRSFSLAAMLLVLFLTYNPIWVAVAYFVSTTVAHTGLLLYMFYSHDLNEKRHGDTHNYGKHLTIMDVFGSVVGQLDNLLMWHLIGPAALATYNFAKAPVDQSKRLLKSLNNIAFPKLAKKKMKTLQNTLGKKVVKYVGLTVILTIAYILLAPLFYQLLFPQYMDAVFYSRVYAIGFLFAPLSLFGIVHSSHAHKRALYANRIIGPLTKTIGLITLVPIYGILGAILALLLASFSSFLVSFYYFVTTS